MSYWIYLEDRAAVPLFDDEDTDHRYPLYPSVEVGHHIGGGTHVYGGTREACLNVTYNYQKPFRETWAMIGGAFDGMGDGTLGAMLGEKRAGDTADLLARSVEILGTRSDPDYWAATPGNAGLVLNILLAWAQQHPNAVWRVS